MDYRRGIMCAVSAFLFAHAAAAQPPQARFFSLQRDPQAGAVQAPAKFFPLHKQGGRKLVFQSSKHPAARKQDMGRDAPPAADENIPVGPVTADQASQLLSIYPPVD